MIGRLKDMKKSTRTDWQKIDSLKDEDIDYSDIPEMGDEFFKLATFNKPDKKKIVTMWIDSDVVNFFKTIDKHYQTKINQVLKAYKQTYERKLLVHK